MPEQRDSPDPSDEVTASFVRSSPDLVAAAGRGPLVNALLLIICGIGLSAGVFVLLFAGAIGSSPWVLWLLSPVVVILLALLVAALILGVPAKRAWRRLEHDVRDRFGVTLVRVANGRLTVRR
jgi:O-antigen ligase